MYIFVLTIFALCHHLVRDTISIRHRVCVCVYLCLALCIWRCILLWMSYIRHFQFAPNETYFRQHKLNLRASIQMQTVNWSERKHGNLKSLPNSRAYQTHTHNILIIARRSHRCPNHKHCKFQRYKMTWLTKCRWYAQQQIEYQLKNKHTQRQPVKIEIATMFHRNQQQQQHKQQQHYVEEELIWNTSVYLLLSFRLSRRIRFTYHTQHIDIVYNWQIEEDRYSERICTSMQTHTNLKSYEVRRAAKYHGKLPRFCNGLNK